MTNIGEFLMAGAASPVHPWLPDDAIDMWPYRDRTVALLKRYARSSVEVGRLPSLLGRECFRTRVTSYSMKSFEDIVIFVHDMEQALKRLQPLHQRLIAMNVLEEYSMPEIARLLGYRLRTVERCIPDALDELSRHLLAGGLLEEGAWTRTPSRACQEGRNYNSTVSACVDGRNIF